MNAEETQAAQRRLAAVYRRLMFENHPDRGGDADTFHAVQGAYQSFREAEAEFRKLVDAIDALTRAGVLAGD